MRNCFKFLIAAVLLFLLGSLLITHDNLPGWDAAEELPKSCQRKIQQELTQAAALLENAATDIEEQEAVLADAGFAVLDTDEIYPTYLANADCLVSFWDSVSAGKDSSLSILRVMEDRSLRHIFFLHKNKETLFFTTDISIDAKNKLQVLESEVLPVYDMELTDWGIFYYRLYPAGDPHYIDYNQIRLQCVDQNLYDLNRKYVLPVGYQMVNLFLCDWQEGHWGTLSFHDLLEFLYARNTGSTLGWEQYLQDGASRIPIPALLFEETILPYFQISLEDFRRICLYDAVTDTYPWQPVHGDDLTAWHYPMCEPEVVGFTENSDGTITLEVQVYSPDLKTDRLFCHRLTVRPLAEDNFQYVANEVTYVSERGLPPNMARFDLDAT